MNALNTNMRHKAGQSLSYWAFVENVTISNSQEIENILQDGWISEKNVKINILNGNSYNAAAIFLATIQEYFGLGIYENTSIEGALGGISGTVELIRAYYVPQRRIAFFIPYEFEGTIAISRKCHIPVHKGQVLNFEVDVNELATTDAMTSGTIETMLDATIDTAIMRGR
jgi:hypothetical protein